MNPNALAPAQKETLLALRKAIPEARTVLVGAAALGCQMQMLWRRTNDLDITVVADPVELARELRQIGWVRHERFEQRWTSRQGVLLDVLPTTVNDLSLGKLVFADSGHVMNLVGFELALSHHTALALDDTTTLDVATVPVIVVLKMAAWLDRPAERDRDLEDLAHVLNDYLDPDDLRRWDDDLLLAGLGFEDQSAFALGQDVGRIVQAPQVAIVKAFLEAVEDDASSAYARLARCFAPEESGAPSSRLHTFSLGLGLGDWKRE